VFLKKNALRSTYKALTTMRCVASTCDFQIKHTPHPHFLSLHEARIAYTSRKSVPLFFSSVINRLEIHGWIAKVLDPKRFE